MGLNKVMLIGRLGADPELRYTPSSRPVCNMRIATSEVYKDKNGQKQEKTEWHRITAWGDLGETCSKYLSKGREIYVEGKIQTRSYEKDGQKHYSTDILALNVIFLGGGKGERDHGGDDRSSRDEPAGAPASTPASDDDIPF